MALLDIVGDRSGVFQIRGNGGTVSATVSPVGASQQSRGNLGTISDLVGGSALRVSRGTLAGISGLVSESFVLLTVAAVVGGLAKVWLGSWQEKAVKVWSGTQWDIKPLKVWSGTQWDLS